MNIGSVKTHILLNPVQCWPEDMCYICCRVVDVHLIFQLLERTLQAALRVFVSQLYRVTGQQQSVGSKWAAWPQFKPPPRHLQILQILQVCETEFMFRQIKPEDDFDKT